VESFFCERIRGRVGALAIETLAIFVEADRREASCYEEKNMTVPFRLQDNIATLDVDVNGYTVTVTVQPRPGTRITTEDADVILTSAMPHVPQRARFPEPLNRAC
jgi:hypothetical protein